MRRLAGGAKASSTARPVRRPGVRPADPAPPAGADPRAAPDRAAAGRHQLPRDREIRPPAELRADGPSAFVSIMEGCSKYCSFCVVPYTRGEGDQPPVRGRAGRSRRTRGGACARSTCWARTSTPTAGVRRRKGRRSRPADPRDRRHRGHRRIRFTTSHPLEFSDALIEAYRDVPQLADYLHLPVQSGSDRVLAKDEARLHPRWSSGRSCASCARCGRASRSVGLHRRLPRRNRRRLREDHEADRGRGLRTRASASSTRGARARLPPTCPTTSRMRSSMPGCRAAAAHINAHSFGISEAMVGSVQRVLVTGPRARTRTS